MSSYLSSNEPYGRVDDGIGAGLMAGAAIGGATYYGTGAVLGGIATKAYGEGDMMRGAERWGADRERFERHFQNLTGREKMSSKGRSRFGNYSTRKQLNYMEDGLSKTMLDKGYGTGRRRAITAGASVLAGGLVGGAIDGMN